MKYTKPRIFNIFLDKDFKVCQKPELYNKLREKFHREVLGVFEDPQLTIAIRDYNGKYVWKGTQEKWIKFQEENNIQVPNDWEV